MSKQNQRLSVLPLSRRNPRTTISHATHLVSHPLKRLFEASDDILAGLHEDVMLRRIDRAMEWFGADRNLLTTLNPEHRNTPVFIGYLAQLVDTGDHVSPVIRELLGRLPKAARGKLPLNDHIHLRLAEGILELTGGNIESAIHHLDFVISLGEDAIADRDVLALAHFWKACCLHTRGKYDFALTHADRGREIALQLGYPPIAAVMQVLQARLHIRKDKLSRAMEMLREAEVVLRETDDLASLGNIYSGYGSVALDEGRYELAVEYFAKAIHSYGKLNPEHGSLARTLSSLAHAKRMISVRIAKQVDAHAEQRRRSAAGVTTEAVAPDGSARLRVEHLREEALSDLARADEIYRALGKQGGVGAVRIERGSLFVDSGDLEGAAAEANEAYEIGCTEKDYGVMAGARLLQSVIEKALYEEGIDEDPTQHAQRAHDYAKDGLTYAQQSEDRQILARAYVYQGLILCNEFFGNADAAKECCQSAGELLISGNRDQLWEEYQVLAGKVLRTGSVDAKLRKWSQGLVENKTFQQMTEEFADLVIPSVWLREGRNVSRVVAKLSISPKKVRRILNRVGLKAAND